MPVTMKDMRTKIESLMRETLDDPDMVNDQINDALESLWTSIITVYAEAIMGGPVTLTIQPNTYRTQLGTVPNPSTIPSLAIVAGSPQSIRTKFFASITLVTDSGTETLPSPTGSILSIDSSHLAQVMPYSGDVIPANLPGVIGFNVYACYDTSIELPVKVNGDPIPIGMFWQEPEAGIDSILIGEGGSPLISPPTSNDTADDLFYIDHMELQTPDLTYRAWDQASIDSDTMRRAAKQVATSTQYQNFYFDVLSNQQLEIRPPSGIVLTPQYFYVKKPRRMKFDQSQIPYIQGPYESFLKYRVLSILKLVAEEYQASQMWDASAEKERLAIRMAYSRIWNKSNMFVSPFMFT